MIIPPQARIAIALCGAALALSTGFYAGYQWRDGTYQKHLRTDAEKDRKILAGIRRIEHATADFTASIRRLGDARVATSRATFAIINTKVPEYVTNTAGSKAMDAAGGLPAGFVQLHNAAALGINPETAAGASTFRPDTPSGVGLSEATHIIAGNYQLYHECRGRLDDWDTWYAKLMAAYEQAKTSEATP